MAGAMASLLEDFSPPAGSEPLGIGFLRSVKITNETDMEPEPLQSKADRQAELIKLAEAKVRAEEREAAARGLEDALAAEKATHAEELTIQRKIWVEQEAMQLSAQIVETLMRLETTVSDRVANILRPFISDAFREQTIVELREVLATILLGREVRHIRMAGPADILSAIKANLDSHQIAVEFATSDHVEVSLLAHDTTVQTQLSSWAGRLEQALKAER
jgi:hypothetical protein